MKRIFILLLTLVSVPGNADGGIFLDVGELVTSYNSRSGTNKERYQEDVELWLVGARDMFYSVYLMETVVESDEEITKLTECVYTRTTSDWFELIIEAADDPELRDSLVIAAFWRSLRAECGEELLGPRPGHEVTEADPSSLKYRT